VDGADLAFFMGCVTGPEVGPPLSTCEPADLDGDQDVDRADFAILQRCFGGPANDACLN
jgi:hypothetical protein